MSPPAAWTLPPGLRCVLRSGAGSEARHALGWVIVGGLGNLPGTAAAAVLLALLEGIVQSFANPTVARITSLLLMSAVLLLRPQGLFKGFAK